MSRVGGRTRVLVADGHPAFRSRLRALLDDGPRVEVVAEAVSRSEAVAAARRTRPDIVLMDVALGAGSGVEATRAILADSPSVAVLGLSTVDQRAAVLAMMRAGARGYLLKGMGIGEISRAVEAARTGQMIFSPQVAEMLVDQLTRGAHAPPFPELTDREREVLELVADGRDNTAISRELHLSVKTVRNHLSRIFAKLRVAHRAEAAVRARRAGLGR